MIVPSTHSTPSRAVEHDEIARRLNGTIGFTDGIRAAVIKL
jgi:hypothetical protein